MMVERDSHELLARFMAGEQQAADEIFDRYARRLLALADSRLSTRLARHVDPEDIVQSAMSSFFARARDGHFDLRHSGDLWRLLAAITLHKVLKKAEHFGAAKRRAQPDESDEDGSGNHFQEAISREPSPDDAVALADEVELLMRGMWRSHRDILAQRLQGASVEEISERMEVSQRHVRRVLQFVEEQLRERLAAAAGGK